MGIERPEVNQEYVHFRNGKTYTVLAIAEHTDTHKEVVVYRCNCSRKIYVRPIEQWFEAVPDPKGIHTIPRFRLPNPTPSLLTEFQGGEVRQ